MKKSFISIMLSISIILGMTNVFANNTYKKDESVYGNRYIIKYTDSFSEQNDENIRAALQYTGGDEITALTNSEVDSFSVANISDEINVKENYTVLNLEDDISTDIFIDKSWLLEETSGSSNHEIACNLGNYGVRTTHQINVYNSTTENRTFVYQVQTVSNLLLAVRDDNNRYMQFEVDSQRINAICTGSVRQKGELYPTDTGEVLVKIPPSEEDVDNVTQLEITIPANTFKIFYIDQVLTTGDPGSIPTSVFYR